MTIPVPSRSMNRRRNSAGVDPPVTMTSKTTTARMAAVTSLTMPSVSRAASTRSRTGTTSMMGVMTVGPVATSSAPMRKANSQEVSAKANRTTTAVPTSAMTAPMVTSRVVAAGVSRNFCSRRWNAPSKTMMATARPTMEGSAPPNVDRVTSPSPSGPRAMPAPMRKMMLGTSKRSASTCATTPMPMMDATR